ncbi:hypothetical protein EIN_461620 [Entamoeba invadens IP1]|uniref:Uncharacterized protein n=1 Tax=Entamoeba invadens IP1 TaxID=370355 RepID=A0A0A1U9S5_ENTIV|nr:hypothetical protein EIN_461620 [Entamoeba invadens IP1]ELP89866.1 hypothetical protein EIN_461620 [Entamoeba invadens IP1]|eukprot:XP_004256637.1 hypothetical protein EIN_461620 [Entamoeba invadens IP1]
MNQMLLMCFATYVSAYFCLKSASGEKRGIVSYELYHVNNITTFLTTNLCGTLPNHPTASVMLVNTKEVELNNITTEVITTTNTQSNNEVILHYTLSKSIPDCPVYSLSIIYKCNQTALEPQIVNVDYETTDPFFCSNIVFVFHVVIF